MFVLVDGITRRDTDPDKQKWYSRTALMPFARLAI
jgi:hypothetical protein